MLSYPDIIVLIPFLNLALRGSCCCKPHKGEDGNVGNLHLDGEATVSVVGLIYKNELDELDELVREERKLKTKSPLYTQLPPATYEPRPILHGSTPVCLPKRSRRDVTVCYVGSNTTFLIQ